MNEIHRLIDRSSLGTPDAVALRATTSDATAARIVARAEQLAAGPPCIAPDVDHYSTQMLHLTGSPVHTISVPPGVGADCRLYFCPTSGDVECPHHGGFDVCCSRPDLHQPIDHTP